MALERSARRPRDRVPEPDRLVPGRGRDLFPVRRKCYGRDLIRMAFERTPFIPSNMRYYLLCWYCY